MYIILFHNEYIIEEFFFFDKINQQNWTTNIMVYHICYNQRRKKNMEKGTTNLPHKSGQCTMVLAIFRGGISLILISEKNSITTLKHRKF